jgi:hypothetical protein
LNVPGADLLLRWRSTRRSPATPAQGKSCHHVGQRWSDSASKEIAMGNVHKEDMTAEEFASLREIGNGPAGNTIPDGHKKRLIELRLIKDELGHLRQTPHGIFLARTDADPLARMPRGRRERWKMTRASQPAAIAICGETAVIELHKFKLGESVEIAPSDLRLKQLGAFKIVRVLPSERGIQQYRIQSVMDGHERVVMESELS